LPSRWEKRGSRSLKPTPKTNCNNQQQKKQLSKKFAGPLMKIHRLRQTKQKWRALLNNIKLLITGKNPCEWGIICVFARRFSQLVSPLLNGFGMVQPNADAVE
jgi:hypothetical protein